MKLALLPALALALVLAGCATPETRLRSGLQNAGLSKAMSACMAERMVDRLSLLQLRRLSALGHARRHRFRQAGILEAAPQSRFGRRAAGED